MKHPDSPDVCGRKSNSEKKLPFKNIRIRQWGGSRKFRKKEGAESPTLSPPPNENFTLQEKKGATPPSAPPLNPSMYVRTRPKFLASSRVWNTDSLLPFYWPYLEIRWCSLNQDNQPWISMAGVYSAQRTAFFHKIKHQRSVERTSKELNVSLQFAVAILRLPCYCIEKSAGPQQ